MCRENDRTASKYAGMKDALKTGIEQQIEMFTTIQVQPDPQKQARFLTRIKMWMKYTRQYEDELTQAIAMSVIPEEVQAKTDQKEQLKALLAWFRNDFFKWTDRPNCPTCGNEGKNLQPCGGTDPN